MKNTAKKIEHVADELEKLLSASKLSQNQAELAITELAKRLSTGRKQNSRILRQKPKKNGKTLTAANGHGYNPDTMPTLAPTIIDPKELGRTIAARRREKGLSQESLAKASGVSRVALARYETGVRIPGTMTLRAILSALGLGTAITELANS